MKKNRPRARKLRRKELGLPPVKPNRTRRLSASIGRMADDLDGFIKMMAPIAGRIVEHQHAPIIAGLDLASGPGRAVRTTMRDGKIISAAPVRRGTGRGQ